MFSPFRAPRLKIQRIREMWQAKSPSEKWDSMYNSGRMMCDFIGIRVLSDMHVNWYSASCGISAALYVFMNIYTVQYYVRRNEFIKGMECTFLVGLVVGNVLMYWESIGPRRFKYHAIINFCGTYFYKTNTNSLQYRILRAKHIDQLLNTVISVLVLMLVGYGILLIGPIYESIYHNIRTSPLATNLPLFEKNSDQEFVINVILQVILIFYSTCGNLTIQMAACMVNHAIMIVPELIRFNLLEFQHELNANGMYAKSIAQLRNCFIQLQDYDRYLLDVIDVYGNKLFICPFVWAFSLSLSIFGALVLHKIGGFGCAITCYLEMIVVCYMGNNVKETKANIAMVYYDMPWYRMPASYQKQVLCVIHDAQNGIVLTIGPLGVLDFQMTTSFTLYIYRFTMVLITMFK